MCASSKKNFKFSISLLIIFMALILSRNPTFVGAQTIGVLPFLTSPYFGTEPMTTVFDHQFPVQTGTQPPDTPNSVVNRNGTTQIHAPSPPAPTPDNNSCAQYSGHAGIDYGLIYKYVISAHKGTVLEAGWTNPENRRTGLGLRVELEYLSLGTGDRINASYKTRYGHLSSLFVETDQIVVRQELIGISGNTGNSGGPHLHFEVLKLHTNNQFYPVNPYGWAGSKEEGHFATDPWQDFGRPASVNLWQQNPSINTVVPEPGTPANHCSYPTGSALTIPPEHPLLVPNFNTKFHVIIDDLDSRFVANSPIIPAMSNGPWQLAGCSGDPTCVGTTYHHVTKTLQPDLYAAMWNLQPDDLGTFSYDVYAYIPNANANTSLAYYEIKHNGQTHSAGIDQSRFNQGSYTRRWAYLGRYDFNSQTPLSQRVLIYHDGCYNADRTECNPHNAPIVQQQMAADALAFVLADPPTLSIKLTGGNNDASRHAVEQCTPNLQGHNVYLGYCDSGQGIVSGFRYALLNLPANAIIKRAHLRFAVDTTSPSFNLEIYGEYNPNSPMFDSNNMPENPNRLLTTAWVPWSVHNSATSRPWILGNTHFSPDLTPIVQELVNHPNWQAGSSSLTFIIKPNPPSLPPGDRHRRVLALERPSTPNTSYAPTWLQIWMECPNGFTCP